MSLAKGALVGLLAVVATIAVSANAAWAAGKVFHVEYSGTVSETAQPYAVAGNSYSESVKFDLTVSGTAEQLAKGEATHMLTASGSVSANMVGKPPEVPASSCQENVSVGDSYDYRNILAVGLDGSVGAELTALLNALTPQAIGRQDFCWVDSNLQWLLVGADYPPGLSDAVQPFTGTALDPGASHKFDVTGSTGANSATVSINTKLSVPGEYAALGDSYSSGEGAGDYFADTAGSKGDGCDRSQNAYPVLLARDLGYPLDGYNDQSNSFAACSGAKTPAIGSGFKGESAQISHVHEDDSLITISIGGNNVGFAPVLKYCLKHKFCEPHEYATVERDLAAVKPAISGVLGLLRDKASDARIVVVGYPNFLPASGECKPAAGILSWFVHLCGANVKVIHQGIDKLDGAIAQEVRDRSNMVFVRPDAAVWEKHTICSPSPWFVRVDLTHALTHSAVFFHPTAEGQRELEREVRAAIG